MSGQPEAAGTERGIDEIRAALQRKVAEHRQAWIKTDPEGAAAMQRLVDPERQPEMQEVLRAIGDDPARRASFGYAVYAAFREAQGLRASSPSPAALARLLAEALEAEPLCNLPGRISVDMSLSLSIEQIARTLRALQRLLSPPIGVEPPPQSRKRGVANAAEIYFARTMGRWFQSEFGKPRDTAVASLTTVLFDCDPLDEEKIRDWRRKG